jgi:hypothetical protein
VFAGGGFQFGWNTIFGAKYQVQHTTDPAAGVWRTVKGSEFGTLAPSFSYEGNTGVITALGTNLSLTQPPAASPRGFYRVLTLPDASRP